MLILYFTHSPSQLVLVWIWFRDTGCYHDSPEWFPFSTQCREAGCGYLSCNKINLASGANVILRVLELRLFAIMLFVFFSLKYIYWTELNWTELNYYLDKYFNYWHLKVERLCYLFFPHLDGNASLSIPVKPVQKICTSLIVWKIYINPFKFLTFLIFSFPFIWS